VVLSKLEIAASAHANSPKVKGDLRILYLEDNPRDVELCVMELRKAGFHPLIDTVVNREDFLAKLHSSTYDVILSDHGIPGWNGLEAFHEVMHSGVAIPFILITGTLGEERAVELIKQGVADYILKDRLARLPAAVQNALESRLRAMNAGKPWGPFAPAKSGSDSCSIRLPRESMVWTSTVPAPSPTELALFFLDMKILAT